MNSNAPYIASITREPFLFYEMRTTAKLLSEGLSEEKVIDRIKENNLFQFPTEKSVQCIAKGCIKRLKAMNDDFLIKEIAEEPSEVAKQICLYAFMKQNRLIKEFMITVIGEKYQSRDSSFGKIDMNTFFIRLQEQNDQVASWSDKTITKIKQVIAKMLAETEYIDSIHADKLNPVWLCSVLENEIRANGDEEFLPAFNCFS